EERRVSLDISGNDFRVVELPGTVLEISPSLQLAFQDDTVNINGDVLIPYLDVQVEEALENAGSGISAVAVSNDVILVDEPQSRLRVDTTGNSGIPVRMRVGVGLGDYVHLSAYG